MSAGAGSADIVQNGLMRNGDIEDAFKCVSCKPRTEPEIDGEGQHESENVVAVSDIMQIDLGAIDRPDDFQIIRAKVILPVLVMKFEVRVVFLVCPHLFFFFIQTHFVVEIMRAVIIWAFIGSVLFAFFPFKESVGAVRAKIGRLLFSFCLMRRACMPADFTQHLRRQFAVIEIEEVSRGVTGSAPATDGRCLAAFAFDRGDFFTGIMFMLVLKFAPIEILFLCVKLRTKQGRHRIDPEFSVMRRFFKRLQNDIRSGVVQDLVKDNNGGSKLIEG